MVPVNPEIVAVIPVAIVTGSGFEEFTTVAEPSTPYPSLMSW
jgi:hypothetical protein